MSNHTNSDILYKNIPINRHVGGLRPPQLQSTSDYIREQSNILQSNNKLLPPNLRYGQNSYKMSQVNNLPNRGENQTNTFNYVDNLDLSSDGSLSAQNALSYNQAYSDTGLRQKDIYLRGDLNRYDPYEDFLYKRGLMSDGYQRRRIKSTYVDINSTFRNTKPSIFTDNSTILAESPLKFIEGSNIMFVNHPRHQFQVKDQITLTGAFSRSVILRTYLDKDLTLATFEIPANCNLMKIYFEHGIPETYTGDTIKISLDGIRGDKGSSTQATFLGSMPVNIINNIHSVKLTISDSDQNNVIHCTKQSILNQIFPVSRRANYFDYSPDYFFVILPINMISRTGSKPYVLSDYNFTLTFNSLAGIPLNQINATYPINVNHLKGFHTIFNIYPNGYDILLDTPALSTTTGGGQFVNVAKIIQILPSYPDPNSYRITLEDVFHNVLAVRLVSSEIPNTDQAIKGTEGNANNKIYWNNIDDGDYLYSITVPPGNYSTSELITTMQNLFLATPRINTSSDQVKSLLNISYTSRNFMQVSINKNTDEVIFKLYKEFILNQPITDVNPNIVEGQVIDPNATYRITITHPNHGMSVAGQTILIQNAISTKGIPSATLNGSHAVESIVSPDQYIVALPKFNLNPNVDDTGGGVNVFIYVPDQFRLRFDQPDTLGTLLGFRDAGQPTSITNFAPEISNQDKYILETDSNTNFLGQNVPITNNSLKLSGENYIIMVANPLKTLVSIGPIKNAFAKIILCDVPGRVLYNTFVPITHLFDDPLESVFELDIKFYNPDGTLFNFNGIDHSFTLEITTIVDIPEGSGINASTGKNYNREVR